MDWDWKDLVPWYLPCSAYNHCFSGGWYLLHDG